LSYRGFHLLYPAATAWFNAWRPDSLEVVDDVNHCEVVLVGDVVQRAGVAGSDVAAAFHPCGEHTGRLGAHFLNRGAG